MTTDSTLDMNVLLTTIYEIQTDLRILVDKLATDRNPDLSDWTLRELLVTRRLLREQTPSLQRH